MRSCSRCARPCNHQDAPGGTAPRGTDESSATMRGRTLAVQPRSQRAKNDIPTKERYLSALSAAVLGACPGQHAGMPKRKTAHAAEANAPLPPPQPVPQPPPLWEVDQIRRDVEFALTRQPGEESAALEGDGHSIVYLSWFDGKVSAEWMPAIEALAEEIDCLVDDDGRPLPPVQGVTLLDFHAWAARQVMRCDPQFLAWAKSVAVLEQGQSRPRFGIGFTIELRQSPPERGSLAKSVSDWRRWPVFCVRVGRNRPALCSPGVSASGRTQRPSCRWLDAS